MSLEVFQIKHTGLIILNFQIKWSGKPINKLIDYLDFKEFSEPIFRLLFVLSKGYKFFINHYFYSMNSTALEIAKKLNGRVEGDGQVQLNKLSKIEEARKGSISFLANPKYISFLKTLEQVLY